MDLSFIRFHVYDAGSNHLMSQRVMPLKCLRPGYRHVRLRDTSNVPLELSTLFIHSKITETVIARNLEAETSISNTPYIFRNRILRRTADLSENIGVCDNIIDLFLIKEYFFLLNRQVESLFDQNIKHLK